MHRPDQPHFLNPPKLVWRARSIVRFPPPKPHGTFCAPIVTVSQMSTKINVLCPETARWGGPRGRLFHSRGGVCTCMKMEPFVLLAFVPQFYSFFCSNLVDLTTEMEPLVLLVFFSPVFCFFKIGPFPFKTSCFWSAERAILGVDKDKW